MRIPYRPLLAALLMTTALPATAATTPGAPVDDKNVGDVVTQPLTDTNIQRREIAPLLTKVLEDPYSLDGIRKCRDIIAAVTELDTVLGPDFDAPLPEDKGKKRRNSAMTIAGGLVSSFVPFRWLIREASGANKADDAYRTAIYAGVVRRGFLKGYGKSRKCKPPGSPVPLPEESAPPPGKS